MQEMVKTFRIKKEHKSVHYLGSFTILPPQSLLLRPILHLDLRPLLSFLFTSDVFRCVVKATSQSLRIIIRHLSRIRMKDMFANVFLERFFHNLRYQRCCWLLHFRREVSPAQVWRIMRCTDSSVYINSN